MFGRDIEDEFSHGISDISGRAGPDDAGAGAEWWPVPGLFALLLAGFESFLGAAGLLLALFRLR